MTAAAPRLVYIAAMSRSGSTLLDLLLDQHPQVASLGELHVLPHDAQRAYGSLPCGCGESVFDCPVWSAVIETTDPLAAPPPRLHHFRETHQWGPTIRWQQIMNRQRRRDDPEHMATYLANTNKVVAAAHAAMHAATATRPDTFVDSSKDPYRAHWLLNAPESDVRVIHLTRDPRAVINSLTRDKTGVGRVALAARRTAAWILENALIANSIKQLPSGRRLRVRYEDLATDPDAVLASIHQWLRLPIVPLSVVQTGDSHALAGNPMRRSEMRAIALDERWRTELPPLYRTMIRLATKPTQKRLGAIYV